MNTPEMISPEPLTTDEEQAASLAEIAENVRTVEADAASMQAAGALLSRMRADIAAISPTTLAFVALQRKPGRVVDAIAAFGEELGEIFEDMAFVSDKLHEAVEAERERLAPLVAEAAQRLLEGEERLARIPGEIDYVRTIADAARSKYEKAGLSGSEIAELTGRLVAENAKRLAALEEERAHLVADVAAMSTFLQTKDTSALPEGFTPRQPVPRVTASAPLAHG